MSIFTPTYATTMYVRDFTPYVVFTLCTFAVLLITLNLWDVMEVFINNNFTRNARIQHYRYNYVVVAGILLTCAYGYVKVIDFLFPQVPLYYLIFLWVISLTPYIIASVLCFILYEYISSDKKVHTQQTLRDEDN